MTNHSSVAERLAVGFPIVAVFLIFLAWIIPKSIEVQQHDPYGNGNNR